MKEVVLSAHERAVRNCPWTVKLWSQYLLAMERHHMEHQVISGRIKRSVMATKVFSGGGFTASGATPPSRSCLQELLQAAGFVGRHWLVSFIFLTRSFSACREGRGCRLCPSVFEASTWLRRRIQGWSEGRAWAAEAAFALISSLSTSLC